MVTSQVPPNNTLHLTRISLLLIDNLSHDVVNFRRVNSGVGLLRIIERNEFMAGCVLRATGDNFQTEKFLENSTLAPCNVFRKGQPKAKNRVWDTSGVSVVIGDAAGDDFAQQVRDAIEFLKSNRKELSWLRSFKGVEGMELDFGVYRKNGFLQSSVFPSELIALAADFGMGIELSIYGKD